MTKWTPKKIYYLAGGLVILAGLLITILFGMQNRFAWQREVLTTYLRGVFNPVQSIPTAVQASSIQQGTTPIVEMPTATITATQMEPTVTQTPVPEHTEIPSPTPTEIPDRVILNSPAYEKQDINNCGPATLAMYLKFYGWEGDQFTISDLIKPIPQDRNVNVEELDHYVRNYAGWLQTIYRVGGDIDLLKQLIAAGIPVMTEESFAFDESYWPNDDKWAGHYYLLNGYDDQRQAFLGQDSYYGADRWTSYELLEEQWQSFNYVYTVIYYPFQEDIVKSILGENWDRDINRQNALEKARQETIDQPENAFAWFNLGSNLVYFGEYHDATLAFDRAREIGWPQRMLRYQFSPFMAYFHSFRIDDLMILTDYALQRTPNSEEALLWQGWGLYRSGKKMEALESFLLALDARPGYDDALYAINYVNQN
ncbi:MAG TPA: C39 family peptidase [Anaerolineaceae bacterium]|nr:C39 family peptidase [Anaerolineaceae bacterium]